jgi:hypothetical protein
VLASAPTGVLFTSMLVDDGASLFTGDDQGQISLIDKGTGMLTSSVQVTTAGFIFGPDGSKGAYGANTMGALASFSFANGAETTLWPNDQPTFRPLGMTAAADGTLYFPGSANAAYDSPAIAQLRPGSAPSLTGCYSFNEEIVLLAPAETVIYAVVIAGADTKTDSQIWNILRVAR